MRVGIYYIRHPDVTGNYGMYQGKMSAKPPLHTRLPAPAESLGNDLIHFFFFFSNPFSAAIVY